MKKLAILLGISVLFSACNDKQKEEAVTAEVVKEVAQIDYTSFGDKIGDEGTISATEMMEVYNKLKPGDTLNVKFTSKVNSVCQSKGCWMRLDLGEKESFVKFKDYAFFMPKDLAGQDVIVEGKAFVAETSVDELKHFAEDAGKSQEEIDAITEPELSYSFMSNGVLVPVSLED